MQPGADCLGFISCTGTNFLVRSNAFRKVTLFTREQKPHDYTSVPRFIYAANSLLKCDSDESASCSGGRMHPPGLLSCLLLQVGGSPGYTMTEDYVSCHLLPFAPCSISNKVSNLASDKYVRSMCTPHRKHLPRVLSVCRLWGWS